MQEEGAGRGRQANVASVEYCRKAGGWLTSMMCGGGGYARGQGAHMPAYEAWCGAGNPGLSVAERCV